MDSGQHHYQISDFITDNSHWGVRSLLYAEWSWCRKS